MRSYNPKRLNEELQIMRKQYTMFYEDYKKNRKKKQKMRQKDLDRNNKKKKKKKRKKKIKNKNKKHKNELMDDDEKVVDVINDNHIISDNHITTDNDDYDYKDDSEYIDATTDATIDDTDSSSSCYSSSSSTSDTCSSDDDDDDDDEDEFLSTTESEIYHKRDNRYTEVNDYDHILMYSKKKTKKNRKRKQYLCTGFIILFCILIWMLAKLMFFK